MGVLKCMRIVFRRVDSGLRFNAATLLKGRVWRFPSLESEINGAVGVSNLCSFWGRGLRGVLANALLARTVKMFIKGIKNNAQRTNKRWQGLIFNNKIL